MCQKPAMSLYCGVYILNIILQTASAHLLHLAYTTKYDVIVILLYLILTN